MIQPSVPLPRLKIPQSTDYISLQTQAKHFIINIIKLALALAWYERGYYVTTFIPYSSFDEALSNFVMIRFILTDTICCVKIHYCYYN